MLFLFPLILIGCSPEGTLKPLDNNDGIPLTDEEVQNYRKENDLEKFATTTTKDNNYIIILGDDSIHEIFKDINGNIISTTDEFIGSEVVKFGILQSAAYVMINDKELIDDVQRAEFVTEDEVFAVPTFHTNEDFVYAIYDATDSYADLIDEGTFYIYDSQDSIIFERFIVAQ